MIDVRNRNMLKLLYKIGIFLSSFCQGNVSTMNTDERIARARKKGSLIVIYRSSLRQVNIFKLYIPEIIENTFVFQIVRKKAFLGFKNELLCIENRRINIRTSRISY